MSVPAAQSIEPARRGPSRWNYLAAGLALLLLSGQIVAPSSPAPPSPDRDQNELSPLRVTDFGARGDGTADDAAAIRVAIAAAPASGGVLEFPPGIYRVGSTIRVDRPMLIRGAGASSSVLLIDDPEADLLVVDVRDEQNQRVHITDLGFKNAVDRRAGAFVNFKYGSNGSSIDHFMMNGGFVGIRAATGASLHIEAGTIDNSGAGVPGGGEGSCGILIERDPDHVALDHFIGHVTMSHYSTNLPSAGIWVREGEAVNIVDCDTVNARNGLLVSRVGSLYAMNSYFDSADVGILITPDPSIPDVEGSVVRSHFIGCWTSSNARGGVYIDPSPRMSVDTVNFDGHHAFFNGGDGLFLGRGQNLKVSDGDSSNNASAGIRLGREVRHYAIANNRCGLVEVGVPAQARRRGNRWGIALEGTDYGLILGNDLSGNVDSPLNEIAPGPHYRRELNLP